MSSRAFLSVLTLTLVSLAYAQPKAALLEDTIDLGMVPQDAQVTAEIQVRNDGDAPLIIERATSSCPCAAVALDPESPPSAAPGETLTLTLTYTPDDRYGPVGAKIALFTNDPEVPALIVDVAAMVEAVVLVKPPRGITWSMAPRGTILSKMLTLESGDPELPLEVLEAEVLSPHIEAVVERRTEQEVRYQFRLLESHPIEQAKTFFVARVQVGDARQEVRVLLRGDVIGDALIYPPRIVSPITAYTPGMRISEITVRASRGGETPDVLGAMVEGPLRAVVRRNAEDGAHKIDVYASDAGTAGPGAGQVHVMTTSEDTPIVTIPVYFQMGGLVAPEPAKLVLRGGAEAAEDVRITSPEGGPVKLVDLRYEQDVLEAQETPSDNPGAVHIAVRAREGAPAGIRATMLVADTDKGQVRVPILIER